MKKLLLMFALVFSLSVASAAVINCPFNAATTPPPGTLPPDTIQCGGLTFDNFGVVPAANTSATNINLVAATQVGGSVFLQFNPSLAPNQDIWLYFRVTGAVIGVDMSVSGVNASITEVVCSAPGINTMTNNCAAGATELARMAVQSGGTGEMWFNATSPVYIYKNLLVGQGGELSSFTQSFHTPEPATFALLGAGLLGFALYRRKQA